MDNNIINTIPQKGYKKSAIGVIPADWKVMKFTIFNLQILSKFTIMIHFYILCLLIVIFSRSDS